MNSSTMGSSHGTTAANNLKAKMVSCQKVAWENPRDLRVVWAALHEEFPDTATNALLSFDKAWEILESVMKKQHDSEDSFNQELYKALETCFDTNTLKLRKKNPSDAADTTNQNFIALDVDRKEGEKYAIGFARDMSCTVGLVSELAVKGTCAGMKKNCKMDLGSCLLIEQRNRIWRATDIFSLVELKTSKTSFKDFGRGLDALVNCDFLSKHGAFCRVLAHTLECVLLYHARNGMLRDTTTIATPATEATNTSNEDKHSSEMEVDLEANEIPRKTIPLAVISGIIVGTNSVKTDMLRWVSGGLLFPNACGDPMDYCVNSFGKFHDDLEAETNSIEMALSLFFETLLFGLRAARRVLRDRVGKVFQPDPMSGLNLMIGKQQLEFPILSSPIPIPEHSAGQNSANPTMVVSQAEFFHGVLDVPKILNESELHRNHFFQFGNDCKEVPVLIKVSSLAVHPYLVHPDKFFLALRLAKDVLASPRHSSRGNEGELVAGPLLAAIYKGAGMITIMADLSKHDYEKLQPESAFPVQLSTLWEGFKDLVTGVLLPLAESDIVHADIRPGYDFTANILLKRSETGKVRMELVDFESLASLISLKIPSDQIGYIQKPSLGWNAFTFVWWQCIFVAYAWLGEYGIYRRDEEDAQTKSAELQNQGSAKADALKQLQDKRASMADTESLQKGILNLKWLPALVRVLSSKVWMDEESVIASLAELDHVFYARDRFRQTMDKETCLDALARYLEEKEGSYDVSGEAR